jgi:hypothetical protein
MKRLQVSFTIGLLLASIAWFSYSYAYLGEIKNTPYCIGS